MYNNFEISLVVFIPNITTNHAITYTNSGLVNFVLESLTFVQIGSIYRKTLAKAGNFYQTWL